MGEGMSEMSEWNEIWKEVEGRRNGECLGRSREVSAQTPKTNRTKHMQQEEKECLFSGLLGRRGIGTNKRHATREEHNKCLKMFYVNTD